MEWLTKHKIKLGAALLLITIILLVPHLRGLTPEAIVGFAPESLRLAAIVFVLLYASKAIVIIPPLTVYYVAAGIVFPAGWNVLVTYLGLTVLLTIGYIIGKSLGKDKVYAIIRKNKKAEALLESMGKERLLPLCFIVRIVPINDVLNLLFGALDMPFWKFLPASLLGLSPYMVPVVLSGSAALNPLSPQFIVPFALSLVVLALGYVIYKRTVRKT